MRPLLVAAAILLATPALSAAQPDPGGFYEPKQPAPASATPPSATPTPPSRMRQPEVLTQRPSGFRRAFWSSTDPAVSGAYRYRMLLLGVAIALITAVAVALIIRRARPPAAHR